MMQECIDVAVLARNLLKFVGLPRMVSCFLYFRLPSPPTLSLDGGSASAFWVVYFGASEHGEVAAGTLSIYASDANGLPTHCTVRCSASGGAHPHHALSTPHGGAPNTRNSSVTIASWRATFTKPKNISGTIPLHRGIVPIMLHSLLTSDHGTVDITACCQVCGLRN